MKRTLIIIPTYNEKENVERLAREVFETGLELELLFVDDNSPDGTGMLCDRIAAADERVNVIHRSNKKGLGRAYVDGFKWALARGYDFIFEMDADLSHRPADIAGLLAAASDADLALGSRFIGGIRVINWPLNRLILSKAAAFYVRLVTGMPFKDPTGGFKCYRRSVLDRIDLDAIQSNGYSFQIETTHQAWMNGFKVVEIPITFEERSVGNSKMSSEIVREAFWMVWKLLFRWGWRRAPSSISPYSVVSRNHGGGST